MVVLLVLLTFAAFITVELVRERRAAVAAARERVRSVNADSPSWSNVVAGFQLPESLRYHRGHTWLHWTGPEEGYVGVDDFARRLIGTPTGIRLPKIGTHLRQGDPAVHVDREHGQADLLSPIEGEVVAVNPALRKDPSLLQRDPYRLGWLYKVRSRSLFKDVTNLLDGSLAARWVEDTWQTFQHRLMLAHGSVLQDGGTIVDDLGDRLDPDLWKSLVSEFVELDGPTVSQER